MPPLLTALLIALPILALVIWELYVCEGTHLGPRFVTWLYDLTARIYDNIKQFDDDWEDRFLGEPINNAVTFLESPLLLDVGAGTARVARTVFRTADFKGSLINVEPSWKMIRQGQSLVRSPRNAWVNAWAVPLPFRGNTFDMVICLEILEFTPSPRGTLRELVRVLRPGGWLITTNRVGREAPWILGKTFRREEFPGVLQSMGLVEVEVLLWQVDYDLFWAQKPPRTPSRQLREAP